MRHPGGFKTVVRLRSRGRGWVRFPCASASFLPRLSSALPVDRFGFRGWHGQIYRLAPISSLFSGWRAQSCSASPSLAIPGSGCKEA